MNIRTNLLYFYWSLATILFPLNLISQITRPAYEKPVYIPAKQPPSTTQFGSNSRSFPWLYLDHDQWKNLRVTLKDPYFKDIHERNIRHLDDPGLKKVSPDTNVRLLKKGLQRSTVAWYITGDSVYLDMALAVLNAACQSEYWKVEPPGLYHINAADLRTGELLFIVSFGYDALYPYLDDQLRHQCIEALIEKGLGAYLAGHAMKDWWVDCDFNWNSALHGNAGIAAMVIRNADVKLSDHVLDLVQRGLPHMISSFYPGGGYIEGVMYQGTAIAHLTDFIVPYYELSGNDLGLLKNEDFHNTLSFWIPMFAPDNKAYNFSDCSEGGTYGIAHGFWWARQLDRPEWAWDQERRTKTEPERMGLFHDVEAFWYRIPYQESVVPELPRLMHFNGIDWAMWRGTKSWLAFRGGYNGGNHDNDDLGNLILGYGKDRFLIDPGYGANKASEHNCITVRGHEQADCANSKITRAFENREGFYIECDISEAFPHSISHYNRHLLFLDDEHLLLIDDAKGKDGNRLWVSGHFQTRFPVERSGKGWHIFGKYDTCRVDLLFDYGRINEEKWNFGGPINRLSYKNLYDSNHSVQPVLFSFEDVPYSYETTPKGFCLILGKNKHEFVYSDQELLYQPEAICKPDHND